MESNFNDLVSIVGTKTMTTSLAIAQVFEKDHKDVLKAFNKAIKEGEFSPKHFSTSYHFDEKNVSHPMLLADRDLVIYVVMGFTGAKAAKKKRELLRYFNSMKENLSSNVHQTEPVVVVPQAEVIENKTESVVSDLVLLVDSKPMTTSLIIAQKYNKMHFHVLEKIDDVIKRHPNLSINYSMHLYIDKQNREKRYYNMDRKGMSFLVSRFTGTEAELWVLKFIEAFDEMEAELIKQLSKPQQQPQPAPTKALPIARSKGDQWAEMNKWLNSILDRNYKKQYPGTDKVPTYVFADFAIFINQTIGINTRTELDEESAGKLLKIGKVLVEHFSETGFYSAFQMSDEFCEKVKLLTA